MTDREANPWRRLSRRLVYENPWIELYHDDVVRPDGEPGIYGLVHFRHRAIGVVPVDASGRILLVGQYRYTLDAYSWEIPEGGGRFDEEPREAAARELAEETGFSAGDWRELCRAELSNSVTDEVALIFVARDLAAGQPEPDATEVIETRWVELDEALAMVRRAEIRDVMSIVALQALALEAQPDRQP